MSIRNYIISQSACFLKTRDKHGGLSNFAKGYPIIIGDYEIQTSEALYQSCRFPDHPEIQLDIIKAIHPAAAKHIAKENIDKTRKDWMEVRVKIMRYCIGCKLADNRLRFGQVLRYTEALDIVEISYRDQFWGAKPNGDTAIGVNALGRLLMELREIEFHNSNVITLFPPEIENFKLNGIDLPTKDSYKGQKRDLLDV
jgi:ribA/ribD-fused uncharacterized protein